MLPSCTHALQHRCARANRRTNTRTQIPCMSLQQEMRRGQCARNARAGGRERCQPRCGCTRIECDSSERVRDPSSVTLVSCIHPAPDSIAYVYIMCTNESKGKSHGKLFSAHEH